MEELKRKYANRDVEFFVMYVREPHAGERAFKKYRDHESFDHKKEMARELIRIKNLSIPVLVDGMDSSNHTKLGSLPNICYVVDKQGKVVYHANWQLADSIDAVLAELVTADDPSRPVKKTTDTSALSTVI